MKPSVFILSSLFGTLAHGGRKDHRCLSDGEADSLFKAYVAAFDGITDGGAAVNKSFAEDFTLYSESNWWVSPHGNGFTDIHKEADPVSLPSPPGRYLGTHLLRDTYRGFAIVSF